MDKVINQAPERVVELFRHVPEFLQDYLEIGELYVREEEELKQLYKKIDELWKVSLIQETGMTGIKRYEKMLGLASDSRRSLEERRSAVSMKWNRQLPYTLRRLIEQLTLWSGGEPFIVDTSHFREYKLRIELFNQTLNTLRDVKDTVEEMIPANLVLLFYGRYPAEYEVPIHYDNTVRFRTVFHPRYNLPYLHLDNLWTLGGSRRLNGYDSADTLDFYPVRLRIYSGAKEDIRSAQQLRIENRVSAEIQEEAALRMQTKAEEDIELAEQVQIRAGAEYNAEYACYMTKLNKMDGTWKLDGSRKLDGGRYIL